jgi:hypothetical protein
MCSGDCGAGYEGFDVLRRLWGGLQPAISAMN